jgi:hypothetical protein
MRTFWPYYVSRAILSALFSIMAVGIHWLALPVAVTVFAGFILYLHSGWFRVVPSTPLFPLRRDDRGREIQRKALIAGIVLAAVGITLSRALPVFSPVLPLAFALALVGYFATQFYLFVKA